MTKQKGAWIFARVEIMKWCGDTHIHSELHRLHPKLIRVKELLMILFICNKISIKYFHQLKLTSVLYTHPFYVIKSDVFLENFTNHFLYACVFSTLGNFFNLLLRSRGSPDKNSIDTWGGSINNLHSPWMVLGTWLHDYFDWCLDRK